MANENKIDEIYQLLEDVQAQLAKLKYLLADLAPIDEQRGAREKALAMGSEGESNQGQVIEGVFDGQHMVGPDGKVYTIPANYASKSKLVAGDILKLTVKDDGSFIYKQIGPVKRDRRVATLVRDDETGNYRALTPDGRSYRLLLASVTYYRGEPNDRVVILVPAEMESKWAAVENIVKNGEADELLAAETPRKLLPLGDEMELESPADNGAE